MAIRKLQIPDRDAIYGEADLGTASVYEKITGHPNASVLRATVSKELPIIGFVARKGPT